MTKIIGFLGRKQSGKNTSSNIIHGLELIKRGMIREFKINENGKLVILTSDTSGEFNWGVFDVTRKDGQFTTWADMNMWPHVKNYAFADKLKEIAISMFGIQRELAYGTDEQKNTIIPYLLWENMPDVVKDKDFYDAAMNNNHGAGVKNLISKMICHESVSYTHLTLPTKA